MPTVQTYQADQVRTNVAGTTQAQLSPIPNAMGNLASGIKNLSVEMKQMEAEASFASAQEATLKFEREKNNIFFNPDTGYFNTQGKTAYDQAKQVSEQLEKIRREYSKDLDANARKEYERVTSSMVTRSNADIMRHSSKNLEAWKMANIQAEVENTIENASLYWNNLKQLTDHQAVGEEAIYDLSEIQGLSPKATDEKIQTYRSSFSNSIISSALTKSASDAEKAMELWGDQLEGPDLISLQEKIAKKKEIEIEQNLAGESVLRAGKLVNQFGDRTDARSAMLEEVNKIKDPDMRKRVMSEATYQLNLKQQADAEERGRIFEVAEDALYRGESMEKFKANNQQAWAKLNATQQKALESTARIQTDYNLFSELSLMDRDELAKVNPSDYFDRLEPTERKQLISMVKEARQQATSVEKAEAQIGRTRQQQIRSVVDQLFPDPKDSDIKRINTVYRLIDNQYRQAKQIKGSELTIDEFNNVMDSVTKDYVIKQSFLGVDWFYPDDSNNISNLSDEQVEKYSQMLTDSGLRPTVESIMRLYQADKSEK